MPETAQTLVVFIVVIVPGFLAMTGYRAGRAVPEHPEGLVTTARVIAVSVFISVIAWQLGGRELYEDARAGTALTSQEAHTYRVAVALLLIPPIAGFVLAQVVDAAASSVWNARDKLPPAPGADKPQERLLARLRRWALMSSCGKTRAASFARPPSGLVRSWPEARSRR